LYFQVNDLTGVPERLELPAASLLKAANSTPQNLLLVIIRGGDVRVTEESAQSTSWGIA